MRYRTYLKGFTIVELLIVIVVIGILAAITIVAYTGIQQRVTVATLQSDLEGAAKQLSLDNVSNGQYPATLSDANNGNGLKVSSGDSYQYTVNNTTSPPTFCLTATISTISYWVSSTNNIPTSGACAGQSNGGQSMITNLLTNPNMTTTNTGWGQSTPGGTGIASRPLTGGVDGGPYYQVAYNPVPTNTPYITKGSGGDDGTRDTAVTAGSTYTASGYVRTSWAASVYMGLTPYDASNASTGGTTVAATALTPNTWTRLSITYTMPANSINTVVRFYVSNTTLPTTIGSTFAVDQIMVTQGSTLYNFADGDSPNWTWSGTPSASSSTGYPL